MIEYLEKSAETEMKFIMRVFLPSFLFFFLLWYLIFSNSLSLKDIILLSFSNGLVVDTFMSVFYKPPNLGLNLYSKGFQKFLRIFIFLLSCYFTYIVVADIFEIKGLPYSII